MTATPKHACERCDAWIREEHGLCGVCKAKDREWPSHLSVRRLVDDLNEHLKRAREIAYDDQDDERRQWRRETYRECEKQLSHLLGALEELEAEHSEPREVTA